MKNLIFISVLLTSIVLFTSCTDHPNSIEVMNNRESIDEIKDSLLTTSDSNCGKELSKLAYEVTREGATERAFSGKYWDHHEAGTYRCVCCDNALFSSKTKFDSGSGWPSYYAPIGRSNIRLIEDRSLGMLRTEVVCASCDAHLGHVFNDGPKPTGKRYCINSVALEFESK